MIGHAEATVSRPKLGIVKLNLGGQGARDQDEGELGRVIVEQAAPLLHRNQSHNGERAHSPSHLSAREYPNNEGTTITRRQCRPSGWISV